MNFALARRQQAAALPDYWAPPLDFALFWGA
jgi:hypothetical protein